MQLFFIKIIFIQIYLFVQIYRINCEKTYKVTNIQPANIKIVDSEQFENVIIFFAHNFTDKDDEIRTEKYIILEKVGSTDTTIRLYADKNTQDQYKQYKIVFKLNQQEFLNKTKPYGRYKLKNMNGDNLNYISTILIYLNDLDLKNPINRYELTSGSDIVNVRYDFKEEILEEYINRIDNNCNYKIKYSIIEKKTLIITLDRPNDPKSITFYIIPEYDKNISISEALQVNLYFQDYILLNDAIYIKKNNDQNIVNLKIQYKNDSIKKDLSIKDESNLNNNYPCKFSCEKDKDICYYEITIGNKEEPGKLYIEYISPNDFSSQIRNIYLMLYESNINECIKIDKDIELYVNVYWTSDMEYDHQLYFNDTKKRLDKRKRQSSGNIISYKYWIRSSSLNSGTFSIYSIIPELSNYNTSNINPVDNYSLFTTIYPGGHLNNKGSSVLLAHKNTEQFDYFNTEYGVGMLDIIILENIDTNYEIRVSKKKGQCWAHELLPIYICNFTEILYNLDEKGIGIYDVYYYSECDQEKYKLIDRKITIKEGNSLLSISPQWIYQNEVNGKNIKLEYNNEISGNILITIYRNNISHLEINQYLENEVNKSRYLNIIIDKDLDIGLYHISTKIGNEEKFYNEKLGFRVIKKIINFYFSHLYFVLNDNVKNELIITVNDDTQTFGCMIEEDNRKINLTHPLNNCTTFYYKINKTGTINFNYYYNDSNVNIIIPIDKNIIVVPSYSSLFYINLFNKCFYYKFDISLKYYNNDIKYCLFLYNDQEDKKISLYNSKNTSYVVYTYDENKYSSELLNVGYYLIISENTSDKDVYLYKSDLIKFTDINVPEYIIKPNTSIIFTDIFCNLSQSRFDIKKKDSNDISKQMSNCKYHSTNNSLVCDIKTFFSDFTYYRYFIENKEITNINDKNSPSLTFASNRINDSNFIISFDILASHKVKIVIQNLPFDFYYPLYYEIGYYKIINEIRDIELLTISESGFNKNKEKGNVEFELDYGNFGYDINYILRYSYDKEGNVNDSIHHYFRENENHIFKNHLYDVEPTFFIYHNYKKSKFCLKIKFDNSDIARSYDGQFEYIDCKFDDSNTYDCCIEPNQDIFRNNQSKIYTIKIGGEPFDIDIIYYSLDKTSKECRTKNDKDFILYINVPRPIYLNLIDLSSKSWMSYDGPSKNVEELRLNYTLKGKELNLIETNFGISVLGFPDYEETFSLQELGIEVYPHYDIQLENNENSISFLSENKQNMIVYVYVNDESNIDLTQIKSFSIDDNDDCIKNIIKPYNQNNSIYLEFDLSWARKKELKLYYIDLCNKTIDTNINIYITSFSVERNYFVLNNNLNKETQRLIFYGPYNDFNKIEVYKNDSPDPITTHYNGKNYYLDFNQNSEGVYKFKYLNNGIESSKTVYVVNELKQLFNYYKVPECFFFDKDNNYFKDIKYNISIKEDDKIKDISIFNSFFKSSQNITLKPTNQNNNKTRIFTMKKEDLKEKIELNNEYYIYLIEKNDTEQPLYVFKFSYTNIALNSMFYEYIYTDASYISFDMNCKIDDIDIFYLVRENENKNTNNPLKCDYNSDEIYNQYYNNYKCYLSENDTEKNALLKFGQIPNVKYGNYFLYYTDKYFKIYEKTFIVTHEIATANFYLLTEEQIEVGSYTIIQIISKNKKFYFNNTEKITYYDSKHNEEKNINFKGNNDYINFTLKIEHKENYTVNEICRNRCEYCRNEHCWNRNLDINRDNFTFKSNTKEILFSVNRKYISKNNSTTDTDFKILVSGSENYLLKSLKYFYYKDKNAKPREGYLIETDVNYEYKLPVNDPGKYIFQYFEKFDDKNKPYNVNINGTRVMVLIANYDYEIFDYSELDKNCLYYSNNEIYASITKNKSYIFEENVDENDIIIQLEGKDENDQQTTIQNIEFYLNQFKFRKNNQNQNINLKAIYSLKLIESKYKNNNLIFTTINRKIQLTSFNIAPSEYFYKDNIVLSELNCKLDNIYIREQIPNDINYYNLHCDEYNNNKSYCDAVDYKFINSKSNYFEFFIGYYKHRSGLNKLIYNSIKDSNFEVMYYNNIINITSINFNMTHINYTIINENRTENTFINPTINSIAFKFLKENESSSNYMIKELVRNDHKEDRKNTIKNKILNAPIIETTCNDYEIIYNGMCTKCYELRYVDEYRDRKWYQNGKCVSFCDFKEEYTILSELYYICSKCETKTYLDGKYYCGCLTGTVKSYITGFCYLPESKEIKELIREKSNVQCYQGDGDNHNYCHSDNTEYCNTYGFSGYLFPQCICKKSFEGKYCEYKENSVKLETKMEAILVNTEIINENNPNIIANIRGVIFYLEINGMEYIKTITSYIDSYINAAIKNLENIVNGEKASKTYPQIFDVLELAIYFLKYKIDNKNSRNLLEDRDNLNYILTNIHLANYYCNKNLSSEYNIQVNKMNLTSFIAYRKNILNSEDFKLEMANTSLFKTIEYIDIYTKNENDLIFVTLINNTLFDNYTEEDAGITAYFSTSNSINNNNDLKNISNITLYVSSKDIRFNFDLAQYYEERKIRIYNKDDMAFVEPCYLSKEFKFDLTQKYRKNNIFQKIYYGSEICNYTSFESKFKRMIFNCTKFNKIDKIQTLYYGLLNFNIKKDVIENANKTYNLPMKCVKKMDDLENNYAFWIFLVVCFIEILYIIGINILTLGSLKKVSFRKGLIHDELYSHIPKIENDTDEDKDSNDDQLPKNFDKDLNKNQLKTSKFRFKTQQDDYIAEDKFNKDLPDCILYNFKELHPLATLCRVSLISPLILHSWFFTFNILTLFGFNALLYYEDLIEKRIYDKKRNNFDYPMRKEFHKIILSILCQIAITGLLKFLLMVFIRQRNNLKISLSRCKLKGDEPINNEIVSRIEQFQDEMLLRRLIAASIMIIIVAFFFFYSVAFCGIYIQTQRNWLFSCLWSLFWNWVVFAPIFIVIISIIEHKKGNSYDPLVYNLKRLFFF